MASWVPYLIGPDQPEDPEEIWSLLGRLPFRAGVKTSWVFRGVGDASWTVRSSLVQRFSDRNGRLPTEVEARSIEENLVSLARRWGVGTEATGVADDVHVLALLQHYGLPTRLLDVTGNPMTALYFATRLLRDKYGVPLKDDVDGIVIAFNVTGLPEFLSAGLYTPTWDDLSTGGARWKHALDGSSQSKSWFIVRPGVPDRRMTAQEGLFLCSSIPEESVEPLDCMHPVPSAEIRGFQLNLLSSVAGGGVIGDRLPGPDMRVVIVPAGFKAEIRQVLANTFGRTDRTMFPDLQGMSETLGRSALEMPDEVFNTVLPNS